MLTAASVHLDIAIPNVVTQEYIEQDEATIRPRSATCRREGGYLLLPEAPGLGIELDETKLGEPSPQSTSRRRLGALDGSIAPAV